MALLFFASNVNAATYYSRAGTGDWTNNNMWSLTNGGGAVATGVYPVAGDNVIIANAATTITVTGTQYCSSVTNNVGNIAHLIVNGSLNITGNLSLSFAGGNNNSNLRRDLTINSGGSVIVGGNFTIGNSGNGTNSKSNLVINGTLDITGTFDAIAGRNADGGSTTSGSGVLIVGGATMDVRANSVFSVGTLELKGCPTSNASRQALTFAVNVTVTTFRQHPTCPFSGITTWPAYNKTGAGTFTVTTYDQNCNPVCMAVSASGGTTFSGFTGPAYGSANHINRRSITALSLVLTPDANLDEAPTYYVCPQGRTLTATPTAGSDSNATYAFYKVGDPVAKQDGASNIYTTSDPGEYYVICTMFNGCTIQNTTNVTLTYLSSKCGASIIVGCPSELTTCINSAASTPVSFTVNGVTLASVANSTTSVVVDITGSDFLISDNSSSGFGNQVTLSGIAVDGSGGFTETLWIRLKASFAAAAALTADITTTCADATIEPGCSVSGTVFPINITVSETSITGLDYYEFSGPSTAQSFTVERTPCINGVIKVTPPANFEISTSSTGPWTTTSSTTPYLELSSASDDVWVRLAAGLTANVTPYTGSITIENSTPNAIISSPAVSVSGTVDQRIRNLYFKDIASRNWHNLAHWGEGACNGTAPDYLPTSSDNVFICESQGANGAGTATINAGAIANCGSLTFQNAAYTSQALIINGTLNVRTFLTTSTGQGADPITIGSSGVLNVGTNMIYGTANSSNLNINAGGTVNISGNFSIENANGRQGGVSGGGTLKIGGNLTIGATANGGTDFIMTGGTLELTGCGQTLTLGKVITVGTLRQHATCTTRYNNPAQNLTFTTYDQNCNTVCLAGNGAQISPYDNSTGYKATTFNGTWTALGATATTGTGRINVPFVTSMSLALDNVRPDSSVCDVARRLTHSVVLTSPGPTGGPASYIWYNGSSSFSPTTATYHDATTIGNYKVTWSLGACNGTTNIIPLDDENCGPTIKVTCASSLSVPDIFTDDNSTSRELGQFSVEGSLLEDVEFILITPDNITGGTCADFTLSDGTNNLAPYPASGTQTGWLLPALSDGTVTATITVSLSNAATAGNKQITFVEASFTTLDEYDDPIYDGAGELTVKGCNSDLEFNGIVRELSPECPGNTTLTAITYVEPTDWKYVTIICRNINPASPAILSVSAVDDSNGSVNFGDYFDLSFAPSNSGNGDDTWTLPVNQTTTVGIRLKYTTEDISGYKAILDVLNSSSTIETCTFTAAVSESNAVTVECLEETFVAIIDDVSSSQKFNVSGYIDISQTTGTVTIASQVTNSAFKLSDNISIDGLGRISGYVMVHLDATGLAAGNEPQATLSFAVTDNNGAVVVPISETCILDGLVIPFKVTLDADATYCIGQNIELEATVEGPAASYTYSFYLEGDPTPIYSGSNNTVSYLVPANTSGDLSFFAEVTNGIDPEETSNIKAVSPAGATCPSVTFTYFSISELTLCTGNTKAITTPVWNNCSSCGVIDYIWTDASGTSATPSSTGSFTISNFQITDAGSYRVEARLNGIVIKDTTYIVTSAVTVEVPSTTNLASDKASGCPGPDNTITVTATYNGDANDLDHFVWYSGSSTTPLTSAGVFVISGTKNNQLTVKLTDVFGATGGTYTVYAAAVNKCSREGAKSLAKQVVIESEDSCTDPCDDTPVFNITFTVDPPLTTTNYGTHLGNCTDYSYTGCATGSMQVSACTSTYLSSSLLSPPTSPGQNPNGAYMVISGTGTPETIPVSGAITRPGVGDNKYYFMYTYGQDDATRRTHNIFTLKASTSELDDNLSYLLELNYTFLGSSAGVVGYFNVGSDNNINYIPNDVSGGWRNYELLLPPSSTHRTQLTNAGITVTATGTAGATPAYAPGMRIGFDNIKLTPLCKPNFTHSVTSGTYCNTSSAVTITLANYKGYDLSKYAEKIEWYKIDLNEPNQANKLGTPVATYNKTAGVIQLTHTIPAGSRDVNAAYAVKVYGKGYPSEPKEAIIKFPCQSANINSDALCVTGGTADMEAVITSAAGVSPIAATAAYTYEWDGTGTYTANESICTANAGDYEVTVTATYPSGDFFQFNANTTIGTVIAPQLLTWNGTAEDGKWSNLANWQSGGTVVIPRRCDNVTIAEAATTFPTLQGGEKCDHIIFKPNTSIGQIQNLTYTEATVQMNIQATRMKVGETLRWYLLTPALHGTQSGHYKPVVAPPLMIPYVRYFYVEDNVASWTNAMPSTTEPLSAGQGFVYRATYIDAINAYGDNLSVPLTLNGNGRFITEVDGETPFSGDAYSLNIDLTQYSSNNGETGSVYGESSYVIVGNPFMSHLNLKKFLQHNSGLGEIAAADVKVFGNGAFTSSESPGYANLWAAPMQAFLVKPSGSMPASLTLEITKDMLETSTDAAFRLRGLTEPENTLRIRATQGDYTSGEALVMAKDGASNGFDPDEDATKIFSAELSLEVSTLVDGKACDVNKIDRNALNGLFVPINVKSTKAGLITLEIDGAIGFAAADNIYLYDNLTQTSTSLLEQGVFLIAKDEAGDISGRFFLQFIREEREYIPEITGIDTPALSSLYIGARQGNVVVQTRDEEILSVTVFDVTGRKALEAANVNSTAYSHTLPAPAAYLVKVVTNKQVKIGKITVK